MRGLKIEMTFRKKMNFSTYVIYGIFFILVTGINWE